MKKSSRPSPLSTMLALVTPATVLSLAPTSSEAAAYIKFDGVDGESTAKGFEGWIEIQSFSWGVSRPVVGDDANKTTLKELLVAKTLDKASPKLFLSCASGETIPTVTLRLTRPSTAGGDAAEEIYYEMKLTDVRVVKQTTEGKIARTERPEEFISLFFPKVDISYTPPGGREPISIRW